MTDTTNPTAARVAELEYRLDDLGRVFATALSDCGITPTDLDTDIAQLTGWAREGIRAAQLKAERDEARAHVLRVESQRMDWQLIHDRLDALVAQLRRLGHPVTGELTDAPAAAEVGGETTAINGYFCAAILDHDHPCPTMCAAPVAQQGQRCCPQHAQPSYRPCPSCPEYARNAWAGTATTGGEADQ